MLGTNSIAKRGGTPYATAADFCRIFRNDMDRLYLLAFLLTGDQATAEQCFVSGLDDSHNSNPVFQEWANSWARRTVIGNAIRMVRPRPGQPQEANGTRSAAQSLNLPAEVAAILELPVFERFAFVMRVLEGYSERECCLLLNCTSSDLSAARIRAFQQIATAANRHSNTAVPEAPREPRRGLHQEGLHLEDRIDDSVPAFTGEAISHLAASA